jgi:hypothetical protein
LQIALGDAANNEAGAVAGATVTSVRPDGLLSGVPKRGVNVFLYQASPNGTWRNADLPSRNANGTVVQRPRVALDLNYLFSFYGDENELEPQRLLGVVARSLHREPMLTPKRITDTIATAPFDSFLSSSNLQNEVERVKFSPLPLSLEELSKLWSVLFQTRYALSTAYHATVVFIESDDRPQQALPVSLRNLYVVPFQQPVIEALKSQVTAADPIVSNQPILVGYRLVISGQQLRGPDGTKVLIGGVPVPVSPTDITDRQISVLLPLTLRAGVQAVQVAHPRLLGEPPVEHGQVESNVEALVLRPRISKDGRGHYQITVGALQPDGPTAKQGTITVMIVPDIRENQRASLQLNELTAASPARAYVFELPPAPSVANSVKFTFNKVEPGDYLVRVRIDGAESPIDMDTNPASPTFGQYLATPKVTIPA